MTITERLSGIVDFLTQGLTRDEEDDAFDFGGEEEYVEDGNALRVTKPEYSTRTESPREMKVVNHPNYRGYEVMIVEPRSFGEAGQMVKHLKDKKTVVLNLHLLDKEQLISFVVQLTLLMELLKKLAKWYSSLLQIMLLCQ